MKKESTQLSNCEKTCASSKQHKSKLSTTWFMRISRENLAITIDIHSIIPIVKSLAQSDR